jgi:hypothetical protein
MERARRRMRMAGLEMGRMSWRTDGSERKAAKVGSEGEASFQGLRAVMRLLFEKENGARRSARLLEGTMRGDEE